MPFKDHDLNQALSNLREMEKEVEELLKEFFVSKNQMLMVSDSGWSPHVDVYETADAFVVKVELAGVEKNEVKVHVQGRTILISGRRADKCAEKRENFHIAEIAYGQFSRRIELNMAVDDARISARFEHGFLRVVVPKAPPAQNDHDAISISS